jgi:DNA-binding transcriptional LysR family regulator
MSQVESRPLRHFVAVAQELSFARAAERLRISAPALSRTVAQLEAQLGVRLLERSTRKVALTDAGSVLLDQAQIALDALEAAAHRAQRAGEPRHRLVLALKADLDGGLLEQTIEAYDREQPGVPIEVMLCGWGEQPQLLREGRADVALVYQPMNASTSARPTSTWCWRSPRSSRCRPSIRSLRAALWASPS